MQFKVWSFYIILLNTLELYLILLNSLFMEDCTYKVKLYHHKNKKGRKKEGGYHYVLNIVNIKRMKSDAFVQINKLKIHFSAFQNGYHCNIFRILYPDRLVILYFGNNKIVTQLSLVLLFLFMSRLYLKSFGKQLKYVSHL